MKGLKKSCVFSFTGNITIMEARWADDISSPCTCLLFILSHYAAVLSSTYESPNASFLFFTAGCSLFFSFTLYFSLSFSFDVSPLNHDRQILVSDSGLTRALGHVGTAQSVGVIREDGWGTGLWVKPHWAPFTSAWRTFSSILPQYQSLAYPSVLSLNHSPCCL